MLTDWKLGGLCLCLLMIVQGCRPPADSSQPENAERDSTPLFPTSSAPDIITADPDFEQLTLERFQPFQADDGTWSMEGNILICSGLPKGYLYTRESYRNFTLRCEFQFVLTDEQKRQPEKASTGFLIAIQTPHQLPPASLEVEMQQEVLGLIRSNGDLPLLRVTDQPKVRDRVRFPPDQWNTIEISGRDGAMTSRLNGEIVCTSEAAEIKEGPIGVQSDGYVVRFRNLRIRRDDKQPASPMPLD